MSALSHLPCEILKEIMFYTYVYTPESEYYNEPHLDLQAISPPVVASHVCRSWRRTLLSDSTNWTCLAIPEMNHDMIMELLQRSGSSLLNVYVRLKFKGYHELKAYDDISNVLSTIFQEIHRFKVLHLRIDNPFRYDSHDLLQKLVRQVLSFIQRPAPQLRTFCFLNSDHPIDEIFLDTLFSGDAPNLKNIHHVPSRNFLELNSPLFHDLSELCISLPESSTLNFRPFLDLLKLSPRLKLLFVDLGSEEVPFETSWCMVDLPCLQSLAVVTHLTIKLVELILEYVKFPSTSKWDIGAYFLSKLEDSPSLDRLVSQAQFTSLDITFTYGGPIYLLLKQNGVGSFYPNQSDDTCLEYSYDEEPSVLLLEFWYSLQSIIISSAITHLQFGFHTFMPLSDENCTMISIMLRSVDNLECLTIRHEIESPHSLKDTRRSVSVCLSALVPNPERVAAFEYITSAKEPIQDPDLDLISIDSEDELSTDSGRSTPSTSEGSSSSSSYQPTTALAFSCPRLCKLIVKMDSPLDMMNAVMLCLLYSRRQEEGYPLQIFVSCPEMENGVESSILQGKNDGIHVSSNPLK